MSFTFTAEEIDKIAHLARLSLEETLHENAPGNPTSASHSIQDDLNKIVRMVGQIQSAATVGIEPMAHPLDMPQPLRKDTITEENNRDNLQKLTQWKEAGLYLVPTVIE